MVDGTENPGTKMKADEKPNGDKKPKDIKKPRVDEMSEVNIRLNVKAKQDTKAESQLTLSCVMLLNARPCIDSKLFITSAHLRSRKRHTKGSGGDHELT